MPFVTCRRPVKRIAWETLSLGRPAIPQASQQPVSNSDGSSLFRNSFHSFSNQSRSFYYYFVFHSFTAIAIGYQFLYFLCKNKIMALTCHKSLARTRPSLAESFFNPVLRSGTAFLFKLGMLVQEFDCGAGWAQVWNPKSGMKYTALAPDLALWDQIGL